MNETASTANSGILKSSYDTMSPMQQALKKKREKLAETKLGLEPSEGDTQDGL